MVSSTVNNKHIERPAGIKDSTRVVGMAIKQNERNIEPEGRIDISIADLIQAGEFVSIKAYDGGNPNKVREEIIH